MAVLRFIPRQSPEPAGPAVESFESATAEVLARSHPLRERSVLYLLSAMIGVLVLFISVVKLDRIVTTTGKIIPIEGTLVVQPLDKAIIRSIPISVGDIVKKGQVLATLDPTFAAADLASLQQKVDSLDAETRRIQAEQRGEPFAPASAGPYESVQAEIFRQRQTEYRSGLNDFDERIEGAQRQIAGLTLDAKYYTQRLGVAGEIEKMRSALESRGYDSRLVMLGSTDQRVEIERNLAQTQANLESTQHQLASLQAQRSVFLEKWHSDNLADLVVKQNLLDAARQDLTKAQKLRELVTLQAPEDAIVLKIADLSVGAVAAQAQPLITLVPLDAPLEADVRIEARDIGFPQTGDPVTIKFDAYKFLEHGTGEGVVKTISQDAFTEDTDQHAPSAPYFDSRITITALKLHDVPDNFRLIPGMTLQADIVVGRRTIMWYLLGGALRSGAEAMHEP